MLIPIAYVTADIDDDLVRVGSKSEVESVPLSGFEDELAAVEVRYSANYDFNQRNAVEQFLWNNVYYPEKS